MTVSQALKQKNKVYVEWVDAHPAVDYKKRKVHAVLKVRATVQDCINIQRYTYCQAKKGNPKLKIDMTNRRLLHDFIIVNWAQFVE